MSDRLRVFISPTVIFLSVLSVFPFVYVIAISFTDFNLVSKTDFEFVGLVNYTTLLTDTLFLKALQNTFLLAIIATVFEMLLGGALAIAVSTSLKRLRQFTQTLLIIPIATTPVAVALMWKYMLNTTYGLVNYLMSLVGIGTVDWLGSTDWALVSIILVDIWQWTPFVFLIVLAGIESIPNNSLEMARVDGANPIQLITRFIVPHIKYFLLVAGLLRIIDVFKLFDIVYVLTEGGPGSSSETLSLLGYRLGFIFFKTGYASAESVSLLAIISLMTFIFIKVFRRIVTTIHK